MTAPGAGAAEPTSAAPEKLMSMNEARAQVGRTVLESIRGSVFATEKDLAEALKSGEVAEGSVAHENSKAMIAAAKELHDSLFIQVKKFEQANRPLILRPERSMKVVRPC